MVKKLFKHEIYYYLRILPILYVILVGVALLGRVIQFFETDSIFYNIVSGSSIVMYVLAIIVCYLLTTIFGIVRFYKNLYSSEGYLTFTLPVTPAQHIFVKATTAMLFCLISTVVVVLSASIITAGDVFYEIVKAVAYIFKYLATLCGAHLPFYIVEILLLLVVGFLCEFLLLYACISLGQMFRKNRILAAVGIYYVYYIIIQVLTTVLVMLFAFWSENAFLDKILEYIEAHPFPVIHIVLCAAIFLAVIFSIVYFIINHTVMRKKLNLE